MTTVLRGEVVVQDGRFVGDRGGGCFVPRVLSREVLDGRPGITSHERHATVTA
jgi:hypothetical protein